MPRNAAYFLARVTKAGQLDEAKLQEALTSPVVIKRGEFCYTFSAVVKIESGRGGFLHGRLVKFRSEGTVQSVRPKQNAVVDTEVPNLFDVGCQFIYIPRHSGVAYRPASSKLSRERFLGLFGALVEEKFNKFFVTCTLEPLSDVERFAARLKQLERILRIDVTVRPPNPLFGPAWEQIGKDLKARKAAELKIAESCAEGEGLDSPVARIASDLSSPRTGDAGVPTIGHVSVADAAILMAADGYGEGSVTGESEGKAVVIRTRDSQVSISVAPDVDPQAVFEAVDELFASVAAKRGLRHQ